MQDLYLRDISSNPAKGTQFFFLCFFHFNIVFLKGCGPPLPPLSLFFGAFFFIAHFEYFDTAISGLLLLKTDVSVDQLLLYQTSIIARNVVPGSIVKPHIK